jgi:hypothetical protein
MRAEAYGATSRLYVVGLQGGGGEITEQGMTEHLHLEGRTGKGVGVDC